MNKSEFMISENIRLRALEPEDLDLLYRLENDTEAWVMSNSTMPFSKYFLQEYLTNQRGDIFADKQLRLVIETKENLAVGLVDLFEFHPLHQRAELGIIIQQEFRQQGYGDEAIELIVSYAFNHLMLHQVVAMVDEENLASLNLFEGCGFTPQATLKEWLFTPSGFKDVHVLRRVRED